MNQITWRRRLPLIAQVIDSRCRYVVFRKMMAATRRFKLQARWGLVLTGAVADFAEPVEEHSAAEGILLLTLVEADVTTTTQIGIPIR